MNGPRSFTVRVPLDIYCRICDEAQAEGKKINTKVNELIELGLGRSVELSDMLRQMLANYPQAETADVG